MSIKQDGSSCVEYNECLKDYIRGKYVYSMLEVCSVCSLYKKKMVTDA